MSQPFFSVIIPVYNSEKYLAECLESVLKQSCKDFEVILVDDGSTDQSGNICDRYSEKNEAVVVFHTLNRGALSAREIGVEQAKGTALLFVDSDDCLHPCALEIVQKFFLDNNCDMVLFNASQDNNYKDTAVGFPYCDGEVLEKEKKRIICIDQVTGAIPNSLCLKAIKKSLYNFSLANTSFAQIAHGEDLAVSLHLIDNANIIGYCNKNLYYYRRHEHSATNRKGNNEHSNSIRVVHNLLLEYIDIWGIPECMEKYHARVVRSYVGSFLNEYRGALGRSMKALNRIGRNKTFREAYKNMDKHSLQRKERMISWVLYYCSF